MENVEMGQMVCTGATMQCSFGVAPGTLSVMPENKVLAENKPAATIMDNVPIKNIAPFGMCITLSNPQVAAATSAALGVLTPQPCLPVIPAPWTPGSPTVLIGNKPALNNRSTCLCQWGGVISITNAGQIKNQVP
jgi:hypothetical protein